MIRNLIRGRLSRIACIFVVFAGSLALTIAWSLSAVPPASDSERHGAATGANPTLAVSGWGSEALTTVREHVAAWSPIAAANACGMGASSCFKCHNGRRAAAPKMNKQTAPWHIDHKTVNHSCGGCHQGNPRLLKKELAHKGLIGDPRSKPAESCASCHKTGNVTELVTTYQK